MARGKDCVEFRAQYARTRVLLKKLRTHPAVAYLFLVRPQLIRAWGADGIHELLSELFVPTARAGTKSERV
jgi:hypothetical protein